MRSIVLTVALVFIPATTAMAATYLVKPDGTGDYPTIQEAVTAASNNDVIELADGTFTGAGNRDVYYNGKAITIRSESGNRDAVIIDCQGSSLDPHIAFYFANGEGNDAILRGVTMINGYLTLDMQIAVAALDSSPTIIDDVFVDNGILIAGGSTTVTAQVTGNLFRDFTLAGGSWYSAINVLGGSAPVTAFISGNSFQNFNDSNGCGIQVGGTTGAAATAHIEGNTFENIDGIAVWVAGTGGVFTGYVENNTFENIGGPGVMVNGTGDPTLYGYVTDNTFRDCGNQSMNPVGAVHIAGNGNAVTYTEVTGCLITDCVNEGITIGGIADSQHNGIFTNNTIVNNGQGIKKGTNVNSLTVSNNILWNNGDDLVGVDQAEVSCCDISDGDFNGVNGNISLDPEFCDPGAGDHRLQESSPCAPFSDPNPACDLIGAFPAGCGAGVDFPDDAFIDQVNPNNNTGASSYMAVRSKDGAGTGDNWELASLVAFDIPTIPAQASVVSATVNLYYYAWGSNNPVGRTLRCYRVTSGWEESTVTWTTRPSWNGTQTSQAAVPGSYGWMSWDVTSDVQGFVNGQQTNYGWIIRDIGSWDAPNIPYALYRTKEYGENAPYLEVVWAYPTPALSTWGMVLLLAVFSGVGMMLILGKRPRWRAATQGAPRRVE